MSRDIYVMHRRAYEGRSILTRPGGAGAQREAVSPLDLRPAIVYRCAVGADTEWLTDPVAVARLLRRHPDADIAVLAVERAPVVPLPVARQVMSTGA